MITKIVLTGGPAAGKTTLISRVLKELKAEDGWKVITVPETATELISGFTLGPFPGCMSMLDFQYFVIGDQLHKEKLALRGADIVPQDKVLIIFDRAVFDDRAYINDEEFRTVLGSFGTTPEEMLTHYDAVLHLVTCAKGAEFAYNYGNAARYEGIEEARMRDDETLAAWSAHPNVHVIDNSVDFEDKINRAMAQIYRIIGESVPEVSKRKYLIEAPDMTDFAENHLLACVPMRQTYLADTNPLAERRIRRQKNGEDYMYIYTEKRIGEDGKKWVTERPISEKEYQNYLLEADKTLRPVSKDKYRFIYSDHKMEIDIYPESENAILFVYGSDTDLPPDIKVIIDVTGDPEYKNKRLAEKRSL